MEVKNKATRIDLFNIRTPQMRAFHMSWFAFFLCFFAWFGIAPLMTVVEKELNLTAKQIGNTMVASVAITILARLFIGWLCDKIGPRLSYTFLLIFGSLPVMAIGLAHSYESFLLFRLGIGVIGASFVITQYHTSVMFDSNCVGTANATSAGWGNLGGGVTQMIMPLVLGFFVWLGYSDPSAWRLSMVVAGAVCFVTGIAYFFLTTDLPNGNFKELKASGELVQEEKSKGTFLLAAKDYRVWALFLVYAVCFGVELTINGMAARYYIGYFGLGLKTAGLVAGLFGLMNIFARTLGGFISDKFVRKRGLKGRVRWLFIALLIEGIALIIFAQVSQMKLLALAIPAMILFSLFVQMSEGATYSIVPFINKKAIGSVSGIVGAGGNMGAVVFAYWLFRKEIHLYPQSLLILGFVVAGFSVFALFVKFSPAEEKAAAEEFEIAMARRREEFKVAEEKRLEKRKGRQPIPVASYLRPMDALRVYLGIALMIKGIYFIMNMADLEKTLGTQFGEVQTVISWLVVFAHVVGGASLMLGFITRMAAGINALVLLGAVVVTASGAIADGTLLGTNVSFQFTVFVCFSLILFVWRGSGPLSVDHLLSFDEEKQMHPM